MVEKTLYLLRHAKSDWDNPNTTDHDRPLAERGRRAAPIMARALRLHETSPDLVICSTAMRARQTLELVCPGLNNAPISIEKSAYTFEHQQLLTMIAGTDEEISSLMVIGHNPALQDLALMLCSTTDPRPDDEAERLARLTQKFPTAAFAAISLCGPWSEIAAQRSQGRLTAFIKPKDFKHL